MEIKAKVITQATDTKSSKILIEIGDGGKDYVVKGRIIIESKKRVDVKKGDVKIILP